MSDSHQPEEDGDGSKSPKHNVPHEGCNAKIKGCIDSFWRFAESNISPPIDENSDAGKIRNHCKEEIKFIFEFFGLIVGGLVALLVIVQTFVFGYQSYQMRRATDISADQLSEIQRTRQLDERAWVGPSYKQTAQAGTNIYFQVSIKNFGKTPALQATMWLDQGDDMSAVTNFNPTNLPEKFAILFPGDGGSLDTSFHPVIPAIRQFINAYGFHWYVYGIVKYSDIFQTNHWTRFCWDVTDFSSFQATPSGNSCDNK